MFEVVKSYDSKNIGMNFITGATTSEVANPVFTVIEMDEELLVPVSYKVYALNIAQSN